MKLNWDYSDLGSNSAVAVPKNTNILFPRSNASGSTATINTATSSGGGEHGVSGMRRASLALSKISIQQQPVLPYMNNVTVPNSVKILTPFLNAGSISAEQEAVNLIVKVSGEIVSLLILLLTFELSLDAWSHSIPRLQNATRATQKRES
jgi:hypothetical protein